MQFTEITHYLTATSTLPALLDAKEAARATTISEERLVELANAGLAPCVRIDKGPPMFFKKDIVPWVKAYLFDVQPGKRVQPTPIVLEHPKAEYLDVPLSLKMLAPELRQFNPVSAIYFLIKDQKVMYVGQSVNVSSRLVSHSNDREFLYDKALYMVVPPSDLSDIENYFIVMLDPPWNTQRPSKVRADEIVARLATRFLQETEVESNG